MNALALPAMCLVALVDRWTCRRKGHTWGKIEIQSQVILYRNVPGCTRCGQVGFA